MRDLLNPLVLNGAFSGGLADAVRDVGRNYYQSKMAQAQRQHAGAQQERGTLADALARLAASGDQDGIAAMTQQAQEAGLGTAVPSYSSQARAVAGSQAIAEQGRAAAEQDRLLGREESRARIDNMASDNRRQELGMWGAGLNNAAGRALEMLKLTQSKAATGKDPSIEWVKSEDSLGNQTQKPYRMGADGQMHEIPIAAIPQPVAPETDMARLSRTTGYPDGQFTWWNPADWARTAVPQGQPAGGNMDSGMDPSLGAPPVRTSAPVQANPAYVPPLTEGLGQLWRGMTDGPEQDQLTERLQAKEVASRYRLAQLPPQQALALLMDLKVKKPAEFALLKNHMAAFTGQKQ
jgi:hypothetical protein